MRVVARRIRKGRHVGHAKGERLEIRFSVTQSVILLLKHALHGHIMVSAIRHIRLYIGPLGFNRHVTDFVRHCNRP